MVSIASPGTFVEGEVVRQRLVAAGVKAQLVTTADGPRLMVFRDDEPAARRLLAPLTRRQSKSSASGSGSRVTSAPSARSWESKPG